MGKRHSTGIKDKVFNYFGFEFDRRMEISNYEDVCNSISLGPVFELICKRLQLNCDKLSGHTVNYVLHLIYEDVITISLEEKVLLQKFGYLWSDEYDDDEDNFFAGIAAEYFNKPEDFIEYFSLEFLCDLFDISISRDMGSKATRNELRDAEILLTNQIFPGIPVDYSLKEKDIERSGDIEFSYDETDHLWHSYSKISGSLYRMVLHKKLTEGDMTLTRQPHFIINKRQNKDDSKAFFQNALQKTKWFIETLEQQSTNHPSYEELLLFEKDTNMLFLLEASIFMATANKNSNKYKYSPDNLKILASFILINDLNIRSYLDAAYYSGVDLLVDLEKRDSYNYFFMLNFILVPFLTKFIKTELSLLVPQAFTGASESEDHTLSPTLRGKLARLYKKDFLYRLVKNPKKSSLTPFRKKLDYIGQYEHIESIQNDFIQLYFKARDVKDRINQNKRIGQSFNLLLATEPLKWYKNNSIKIMDDIDGAIEYLAGVMSDDFEDIVGMNSNSSDSKITLEKIIDDLDSYFKKLNNAEEVKLSQDKLLRELNKLGWNLR